MYYCHQKVGRIDAAKSDPGSVTHVPARV